MRSHHFWRGLQREPRRRQWPRIVGCEADLTPLRGGCRRRRPLYMTARSIWAGRGAANHDYRGGQCARTHACGISTGAMAGLRAFLNRARAGRRIIQILITALRTTDWKDIAHICAAKLIDNRVLCRWDR